MTPLAAYLANQLVVRPKHRENIWIEDENRRNLRTSLDDIHCFEVTACIPLFRDLSETLKLQGMERAENLFEKFAFLPAPKTWIEWKWGESGRRVSVLLEEKPNDTDTAVATLFCDMMATNLGAISTTSGDYYDFGGERMFPNFILERGGNPSAAFLSFSHVMLLLINSPKIIGRQQHMPNAGLERRLNRGFRGSSFPLHSWTEVLLKVNKPIEIDDGEEHEAHLTGSRALHFVRKHIRIRRGRLEYVSAHWRGDPSIGMKQTRYVVAP